MRKVGLPGTPWSVKPSQQKSAKPHALCCQAHAKLVPSKALFLPSWPWAPFSVWRKPTLPCQAIAPSTLYIILICEKKTRSPGRERGITRSPGRERGDSRILSHGRGHWNRKESSDTSCPPLPTPPPGGGNTCLCVLLFVLLRVAMT